QLERRADAASVRPDWPKRVLLPAVWREIDARPRPVITARLSPKWSVVAVVVALLFLIVAAPRAFLPSASGSPSPASPAPTASGVLPDVPIRLTCEAPVVPGHCLGTVAWAVQHLPAGLAPVAAVAIMYLNLCPDTLPRASCIYPPHHDEWWAEFTLRDG